MNILDRFKSKDDFLKFRDHLGQVMKKHLSLPLKPRKLDELVAQVVGARDFNTALATIPRVKVRIDRGGHCDITAEISSDDEIMTASFDAAPFFEEALANGTLVITLRNYLNQDNGGNVLVNDELAHFIAKEDDHVKSVIDYALDPTSHPVEGEVLDFYVGIEENEITDWLLNKQLFLLASWVDAYQTDMSLTEYEAVYPNLCYHLDHPGIPQEITLNTMGPDFSIIFDHGGTNNFKWKNGEVISERGFTNELAAIVDFLDSITIHPSDDSIPEESEITHWRPN